MPVTKYKLYSTESEWDDKNTSICAHLGIPSPQAERYADKATVQNPESDDFGKFIMPVITSGPFKCDDQFSDPVDWDNSWDILPG